MPATDAVRRDFVEFWGSLGAYWGIPPRHGARLRMDEIAAALLKRRR